MAFQYSDDENLRVKIFYGWGYDAANKVSKDVNDFITDRHLADDRIVDIRMSGGSGGTSDDFAAVLHVMVVFAQKGGEAT